MSAAPRHEKKRGSYFMAWGRGVHGQLGVIDAATLEEVKPQPALQLCPRQALYLAGERVTQVVAGAQLTAFVTVKGTVYACGANGAGELGESGRSCGPVGICSPVPALRYQDVLRVACGDGHVIAITSIGKAFVWGLNSSGQLGLGHNRPTTRPHELQKPAGAPEGGEWVEASAGAAHTVATLGRPGGPQRLRVYSWGEGSAGCLGHGDVNSDRSGELDRWTPTEIIGIRNLSIDVVQLACGSRHSLILTRDQRVYSFGLTADGRLGHPFKRSSQPPLPQLQIVPLPLGAALAGAVPKKRGNRIRQGVPHTSTAPVHNSDLPETTSDDALSIEPMSTPDDARALVAPTISKGASMNDLSATEAAFELDPDAFRLAEPQRVSNLAGQRVAMLAAGGSHSIALTSGAVFAWGSNLHGQLALDELRTWTVPQPVPALSDRGIVWIGCGERFTAAHTISGHVLVVGDNTEGQCAQGAGCTYVQQPTKVTSIPAVLSLGVGNAHVVCITQPPKRTPRNLPNRLQKHQPIFEWEEYERRMLQLDRTMEEPREAKIRLRAWALQKPQPIVFTGRQRSVVAARDNPPGVAGKLPGLSASDSDQFEVRTTTPENKSAAASVVALWTAESGPKEQRPERPRSPETVQMAQRSQDAPYEQYGDVPDGMDAAGITKLVNERAEANLAKDYPRAEEILQTVAAKGIRIRDDLRTWQYDVRIAIASQPLRPQKKSRWSSSLGRESNMGRGSKTICDAVPSLQQDSAVSTLLSQIFEHQVPRPNHVAILPSLSHTEHSRSRRPSRETDELDPAPHKEATQTPKQNEAMNVKSAPYVALQEAPAAALSDANSGSTDATMSAAARLLDQAHISRDSVASAVRACLTHTGMSHSSSSEHTAKQPARSSKNSRMRKGASRLQSFSMREKRRIVKEKDEEEDDAVEALDREDAAEWILKQASTRGANPLHLDMLESAAAQMRRQEETTDSLRDGRTDAPLQELSYVPSGEKQRDNDKLTTAPGRTSSLLPTISCTRTMQSSVSAPQLQQGKAPERTPEPAGHRTRPHAGESTTDPKRGHPRRTRVAVGHNVHRQPFVPLREQMEEEEAQRLMDKAAKSLAMMEQ